MRKGKKLKVHLGNDSLRFFLFLTRLIAVTLEGTVIHKSGLITGGRSTHDVNKRWNEKDVEGMCNATLD